MLIKTVPEARIAIVRGTQVLFNKQVPANGKIEIPDKFFTSDAVLRVRKYGFSPVEENAKLYWLKNKDDGRIIMEEDCVGDAQLGSPTSLKRKKSIICERCGEREAVGHYMTGEEDCYDQFWLCQECYETEVEDDEEDCEYERESIITRFKYWLSWQCFRLYMWLGDRCYHCQGAGSGINWQGCPMECPKCDGSGMRK